MENTLEVVDGRTAQAEAILLAHQDLAHTLQVIVASKSKATSGELVVYGFALGLLIGGYLMEKISHA